MINSLYQKFILFLSQYGINNNVGTFLFSPIPFFFIISALILTVLILVLAERKLLGYFTQRKGPNRVGIWGILQTVADGIKILCKENIEPSSVDNILYSLAPIISFTAIILLWCLIPYNADFYIIQSDISVLIFYFVSSIPALFNFLAGYSSNNKYSLLGCFRGILLFISYSVAFLLVLLSITVIANSMDFVQIINSQTKIWNIFINFIGFLIFYICILAKLHRCPFDLTEAESELVCGFHTEYSGMRFAMFFLSEYAELAILSALVVILFFGGYLPPFNFYLSNILLGDCSLGRYLIYLEQSFWLIAKTICVIFTTIWIRASFPRLKPKHILDLFWKYLIPIGLINLIILEVLCLILDII